MSRSSTEQANELKLRVNAKGTVRIPLEVVRQLGWRLGGITHVGVVNSRNGKRIVAANSENLLPSRTTNVELVSISNRGDVYIPRRVLAAAFKTTRTRFEGTLDTNSSRFYLKA
jgi:hypothetical protein